MAALRCDRIAAPYPFNGPINGQNFLAYVERFLVSTLPPYSFDLYPIEQAFAKLKHWLRQAQARSNDEIYSSIASSLKRFQSYARANYLKNAGYAFA